MTTADTTTLTGSWAGDPVHSDLSFRVRHMAVGKVRGNFSLASATLTFTSEELTSGSVTAEINAASVDTNQEQRDAHVRSADFLDAENHPTLTFVSTELRDVDGDTFVLAGDLTIRGTTRPVELAGEFQGQTVDAYGNDRMGFSATTSISRKDFGVSFSAVFGAGNAVVADKVDITIDIEFVRA